MMNGVDFWYRKTYRLSLHDPRYQQTTLEERLSEYWAWQYQENPKLLDVVEDDSFDLEDIQRQWAEELGEEPDVVVPGDPPPPVNIDEIDESDWEDMNTPNKD
ncbi:hypothetical protein ZX59_004307 [Salmonella enterica subsp. enterica]|nr:hypothetical protein [Salmonella enterica subsp. enterica]